MHLEVQGYFDPNFARRMFIYNYRTFDRYNVDVVSLAILADSDPRYRPSRFEVTHWGFRCLLEFPTVKLLDYRKRLIELESSTNPFAVLVSAHLRALATQRHVAERLSLKVSMVKALYERGYGREDVLRLYRFIDELLALPEELTRQFHREIRAYEEETKMTYITTAERIGIEIGIQQGIQQGKQEGLREGLLRAIRLGLEIKFESAGLRLYPAISKIQDLGTLEAISEALKIAKTPVEIERFYKP